METPREFDAPAAAEPEAEPEPAAPDGFFPPAGGRRDAPGPSEFERAKQAAAGEAVAAARAKPTGSLARKFQGRLAGLVLPLRERPPATAALRDAYDAAAVRALKDALGPALPKGLPPERLAIRVDGRVTQALVQAVEATGAILQHVAPRWNAIDAAATLGEISAIADLPGVDGVCLRYGCVTNTGAADNQADQAMNANQARANYSVTGAGQKVGILSDSVHRVIGGSISNNILTGSSSQNTGDLPAQVEVYDPGPAAGATDEGAAMLELVHDVAPGAKLAFASAFTSDTAFADNIALLRARGCTITCDDVIYFAEPMFQDGPIAQAVNGNATGGVPHFSSAGNNASKGIAMQYADVNGSSASTAFPPTGVDFHNWGIGGSTPSFLPVTLASGASVSAVLQWNQPHKTLGLGPGSSVDMDMYIYDGASTGSTRLDSGVDAQYSGGNPSGDPFEYVTYTNNTGSNKTVYLALDHYTGVPTSVFFRIVFYTSGTVTFDTSVVNASTIYGHTAATKCISVGAVFFYEITGGGYSPDPSPGAINAESFSSKGGIGANGLPFYFDTSGNLLGGAPVRRDKPDLAAPDGGNTTFFGSDIFGTGSGEPDTFPNFFGTSAAAPNAAAVAALMRERNPSLSAGAIKSILQSTAIDVVAPSPNSPAGADAFTGTGRIDANAAVGAVSLPTPISIANVQIVAPANPNAVPKYGKVELLVTLNNVAATRFYDPDPVGFGLDLSATFTGPGGSQTVNGYYDGANWRVRFAPRETGSFTFTVKAIDSSGTATWTGGAFTAVASADPGFLRVDGHYLRFSEGPVFFGVGHNTGWQYDVEIPPFGGPTGMKARGENLLSFWMNAPWVRPDDAVTQNFRTPIENAVEGIGNYNQNACAWLDGVVQRAEQEGIYLLPSIWAHPSLRDDHHSWGTGNWDNNAYRALGAPKDFFNTAAGSLPWIYQQKFYRYMLARWGYSTKIAGWVALVEIEGTTGYAGATSPVNYTDPAAARTWCGAMRDYFRANDPYRANANKYPLTVSKSNAPTFYTEVTGELDVVSSDSYASKTDDFGVAGTIATETGALTNSFWASGHPGIHTEFGGEINSSGATATQPKHLHNGIWAGTASGACMTPLLWTDGPLSAGQHFPFLTDATHGAAMRNHLEILSKFMSDVDYLGNPYLHQATVVCQQLNGTASGTLIGRSMITMDRGYLWAQVSADNLIINVSRNMVISGLDPGTYEVKWYNIWQNGATPAVTDTGLLVDSTGRLFAQVPQYSPNVQDTACKFKMTSLSALDFGDAPDSYHTLRASNGARHFPSPTGPQLGASRDVESDGQPSAAANGDGADEDGVSGWPSLLVPGQTYSLTVNASGTGPYRLSAWMDFDGNGSFADAGEKIANHIALVSGNNTLSVTVPSNAALGPTYARFRIYSGTAPSFDGYQSDGEIEDYAVTIAYSTQSVVISELRTRGPNGAYDEFVEIKNVFSSALDIGGYKLQSTNGLLATVPSGTQLSAGAYYLFTCARDEGGLAYSGSKAGNQTYNINVADSGGYAITNALGVVLDQVGFSSGASYKEGTALAALSGDTNRSYERKAPGVNRTDTNNNVNDFVLNTGSSNPQGTTQISGFVFDDLNRNGVKDSGEIGLANVRIYIDANESNTWDPGEASVMTDATGKYVFNDLAVAQQRVAIDMSSAPATYGFFQPKRPLKRLGRYSSNNHLYGDVWGEGTLAVLGSYDGNTQPMEVIDISDPYHPKLRGSWSESGGGVPASMNAHGKGAASFRPSAGTPSLLHEGGAGGEQLEDVVVQNQVAFVASNGDLGIHILDIANPTPVVLAHIDAAEGGSDKVHTLWLDGHLLYFATNSSTTIYVFDVSEFLGGRPLPPSPEPVLVRTITAAAGAAGVRVHEVTVRNGRMYVAVNEGQSEEVTPVKETEVWDVSQIEDAGHPVTLLGSYDSGYNTHTVWGAKSDGSVVISAREPYPWQGAVGEVTLWDFSNPASPSKLSTLNAQALGLGDVSSHIPLTVNDKTLYMSWYWAGVVVFDISDPAKPVLTGRFDTTSSTSSFNGCWGTDPFMPNGLILASDIQNGLFTLQHGLPGGHYVDLTVTPSQSGMNFALGVGLPTPVKIEGFAAKQDGLGVLVEWTCASELENLGFHVYRREAKQGGAAAAAADSHAAAASASASSKDG
ncbi:MAG: DUF5060 domain-containing protein, partial [Planctomycetota bacterium]|nr:DUF5060 domain-containing protein [Planctomycetota bacterium]